MVMFNDAPNGWIDLAWNSQNASFALLNIQLFRLMAAGPEPNETTLACAIFLAKFGGWFAYTLVFIRMWYRSDKRTYLLAAILLSGCSAIISHAFAAQINNPRPFIIGLSPQYLPHGNRGSLPSTHATVLGLLGFLCLFSIGLRFIGLCIISCTLLVGWARIYTGLHFPFDILAGLILACALALIIQGFITVMTWIIDLPTMQKTTNLFRFLK